MATTTEEKTDALTTRQVAEELGTDPRTLRKFLRSRDMGVGTGSRYEFTKKDIAKLKKGFADWSTDQEKAKAAREAKKEKKGNSRLAQAAREGATDDEATETEATETDLDQLTIAQLKRFAQDRDIALPSKMKRAEMIAHLREQLTS